MKIFAKMIATTILTLSINVMAFTSVDSQRVDSDIDITSEIDNMEYLGLNDESARNKFLSEELSANSKQLELAQAGAWYCIVGPNFSCYMTPGVLTAEGASCTCLGRDGYRYTGRVSWIYH